MRAFYLQSDLGIDFFKTCGSSRLFSTILSKSAIVIVFLQSFYFCRNIIHSVGLFFLFSQVSFGQLCVFQKLVAGVGLGK